MGYLESGLLADREIIANSIPSIEVSEDVTLAAILGSTPNSERSLPYKLRKVQVLWAADRWGGVVVEGNKVLVFPVIPVVDN